MRIKLLSDDVFIAEESYENQIIEAQGKYEKVWDGLYQLKSMGPSVEDKEKENVREIVDDLVQNMHEIKDIVMKTARHLLTTKEINKLEDQDENSSSDPSIQFFGLEWSLFLPRWSHVGESLLLYWTNLESGIVDISGVRGLHQLINYTVEDISLHCLAVITDQLSEDKLREQMLMQQKMTSLGKLRKLDEGKVNGRFGDSCFIQGKSCHVNQYLETADCGTNQKQMSFRFLQREGQKSRELKFATNKLKDEQEDTEIENIFSFFSNVVQSKLGIRCKSIYNPRSPRKSLSGRRKSSKDVYRANRNNMLENISVLATGPCGVGMGIRSIFMDDKDTQPKE